MSENLWAPWRMEYILGKKANACVFCARDPELVVATQSRTCVMLNKFPFAAGHLLVIPNAHVSDVTSLDESDSDEFFRLVRQTVARLRKALLPDGINVGINLGRAAGAGIAEHLHAHVVPRWNGDSNFMPVIADTRVMPEYLQDTHKKLLPHFADLSTEAKA